MFFWWVINDNIGTKIANKSKDAVLGSRIRITNIGKAKEAINEANEIYFEIKDTTTKTTNENKAANPFKQINKPKIVAIPFPPLKPV